MKTPLVELEEIVMKLFRCVRWTNISQAETEYMIKKDFVFLRSQICEGGGCMLVDSPSDICTLHSTELCFRDQTVEQTFISSQNYFDLFPCLPPPPPAITQEAYWDFPRKQVMIMIMNRT